MRPKIKRRARRGEIDRANCDLEQSWKPPDKNSNARVAAGIGADSQGHFGANIVNLARPRRNCVECGIQFRAIYTWHTLCAKCYHWSIAGFHNAMAAAALRRARA